MNVPVVGVQRFVYCQYNLLQTFVKVEFIIQGWNIEVEEGINERMMKTENKMLSKYYDLN